MTRDENEVLHDHGERLARIEATVSNHIMTELVSIKGWVARLDARLWWILGTLVLALAGIVASLMGVRR